MERIKRIRQNYVEFIYGIGLGIALASIVFIFTISYTIFIQLATLLMTSMIMLKLFRIPKVRENISLSKKEGRRICPECGSPARHKKNCSRGKQK